MRLPRKLETLFAGVANPLRKSSEIGADAQTRAEVAHVAECAHMTEMKRGADLAQRWEASTSWTPPDSDSAARVERESGNPLRSYFDSLSEGRGVWKWLHYFELYQRHLQKFVGRPVTIVEVGVYSGGSLGMWRHYFGADCRVHGVDIEQDCTLYNDSRTTIHIGDQADREFWKRFRLSVPDVDVLVDDGGHQPEQQMVTLEEMLPHLRPGGVYICEDVHEIGNPFAAFAHSLADGLNAFAFTPRQDLTSTTTQFQAAIDSVHLYPYVVVIEKRASAMESLSAPKRGSQWQPFL